MTRLTMFLAAGAATVVAAIPAAAQTPYQSPYGYPQQGYPQPGYPQQGYAYPNQGQAGISEVINQLLGNRYQANDRNAVERCATAAMTQANAQYRPNNYRQGYGYQNQGYGYGNQGYYPGAMRVTAITDVKRRSNGVRVSGLLDSQFGGRPPYGQAYGYQGQGYQGQGYQGQGYQGQGYQGQGYAGQGDLTFRCNVDYRGAVSNVRIGRNSAAYRRSY